MAELGASKKDILEVAGLMGLSFTNIEESDRKLLEKAFDSGFDESE